MRISTSQIYSQSLLQMNAALSDIAELNSMTSSQKKLNRPSDDPTGMGKVIELRAYNSALSGYSDNCTVCGEHLSLADEALSQASEQITAAKEVAEQGSTETYTAVQLQAMAIEMEGYLDSLMTIANTKFSAQDYVFGGDDSGEAPYEKGLGVTLPNDSLTRADFVSLTGELDSSIAVRFDSDGAVGTDELTYSYSTDYGETWTTATLAAGDTTLDLGAAQAELASGAAVTAADDDGNGTQFHLREAVVYTGSENAMSVAISESTDVDMNSVGGEIFGGVDGSTGLAYDGDNLFETISDCIVYLENGDYDGVADCLAKLGDAHENVETAAADIGARENKTTYIGSAISVVKSVTANNISGIEDADSAQLVVELEQANYVYEAVLSSSSDIIKMSLLNYI
ncbi:flagellin [Pseudodesulfovibrio sp.]|uniref:flagellin N-terminal helical domain-containing protein n=1 Tax=Pseudodesulfovibrio sp. TaxID=2035812 RepID=UPI002632C1E3|nr:flagellin [Pseudodesulfovibrio sp.]MDD3311596.1 flagellin [Pseudodesulfovibrio sp.]